MREKQQQTNQVESFWREISNWCRCFYPRWFVHIKNKQTKNKNKKTKNNNNNAGMKKRTLKTKYPVFLSLVFQTMR